jgi:hypothetical protein
MHVAAKLKKNSEVVSPIGRGFIFTTFSTTTLWEKQVGNDGQTNCVDRNRIRVAFIKRKAQVHG